MENGKEWSGMKEGKASIVKWMWSDISHENKGKVKYSTEASGISRLLDEGGKKKQESVHFHVLKAGWRTW